MTNPEKRSGEKLKNTLLILLTMSVLALGYDRLSNPQGTEDDNTDRTSEVTPTPLPTATPITLETLSQQLETLLAANPTQESPDETEKDEDPTIDPPDLDELPYFLNKDSDETPHWGSTTEQNKLFEIDEVLELIEFVQQTLEERPDEAAEILARQAWYADLIGPAVYGSERNVLIPELRGHGLTANDISNLLEVHDNYQNLFTPESWELAHRDPTNNQVTDRQRVLRFDENIFTALRNTENSDTNIQVVTEDDRLAYLSTYRNAQNSFHYLESQIVSSLLTIYPNIDQDRAAYVAERLMNRYLSEAGLLQGTGGYELVDTDGDGLTSDPRGRLAVVLPDYENICRVSKRSVASGDPLDQVAPYITDEVDLEPITDDPFNIRWARQEINSRGQFKMVFTIDPESVTDQTVEHSSGETLFTAMYEASTFSLWNTSDRYIETPAGYEQDRDEDDNAQIIGMIVCGPAPETVPTQALAVVTPPPQQPPQSPPPEEIPPRREEPEKSNPGNQTNPDGETEPDPTGGEVIIDGQIDTDGDGEGDTEDNIGSGR